MNRTWGLVDGNRQPCQSRPAISSPIIATGICRIRQSLYCEMSMEEGWRSSAITMSPTRAILLRSPCSMVTDPRWSRWSRRCRSSPSVAIRLTCARSLRARASPTPPSDQRARSALMPSGACAVMPGKASATTSRQKRWRRGGGTSRVEKRSTALSGRTPHDLEHHEPCPASLSSPTATLLLVVSESSHRTKKYPKHTKLAIWPIYHRLPTQQADQFPAPWPEQEGVEQ